MPSAGVKQNIKSVFHVICDDITETIVACVTATIWWQYLAEFMHCGVDVMAQ